MDGYLATMPSSGRWILQRRIVLRAAVSHVSWAAGISQPLSMSISPAKHAVKSHSGLLPGRIDRRQDLKVGKRPDEERPGVVRGI